MPTLVVGLRMSCGPPGIGERAWPSAPAPVGVVEAGMVTSLASTRLTMLTQLSEESESR